MTRREALKASSEFSEGSEIPKPPSLAGSANSLFVSLKDHLVVVGW